MRFNLYAQPGLEIFMGELINNPREEGWVAVQLKANALHIAEQNLQRQNFGYFSPKLKRTERRFGKFKASVEPLFPGYLFVKAGHDPATWRMIGNTLGIAAIVRNGTEPSFLNDALVHALRDRCDSSSCFKQAIATEIGSKVKIISGPFASIIATVGQLEKDGRIKLLFEELSRSAQFWTKPENVILA